MSNFLESGKMELVIYRTNIQSGGPGHNYLVYKVVVSSTEGPYRYNVRYILPSLRLYWDYITECIRDSVILM
jgi:hypothetical protein